MRTDHQPTVRADSSFPTSNGDREQVIGRKWITPDMIRHMRPPVRLRLAPEQSLEGVTGRLLDGRTHDEYPKPAHP